MSLALEFGEGGGFGFMGDDGECGQNVGKFFFGQAGKMGGDLKRDLHAAAYKYAG